MSHLHLTPENPSLSSYYFFALSPVFSFLFHIFFSLSLCFGISNGLAQQITAQFTLNLDLDFFQKNGISVVTNFRFNFLARGKGSPFLVNAWSVGAALVLAPLCLGATICKIYMRMRPWLTCDCESLTGGFQWMTYNCKVYRLVTKKIQESKKDNWENKNKNLFGYHKKNLKK